MVFVIQSLVSHARPIPGTTAWTTSTRTENALAPTAAMTGRRHRNPAKNATGTNNSTLAVDSTAVGARYGSRRCR